MSERNRAFVEQILRAAQGAEGVDESVDLETEDVQLVQRLQAAGFSERDAAMGVRHLRHAQRQAERGIASTLGTPAVGGTRRA